MSKNIFSKNINSLFGILVVMFSPLIAYMVYIGMCFFGGSDGCNQGEGIIFSFFLLATIPIGVVLLISHSIRKNKGTEGFVLEDKSPSYKFFYRLTVGVLLCMILAIFYYMSPLSL